MDLMESLTTIQIGPMDAAIRLILAMLAGGLVGMEREMRRQTAGLRTHILISLGSCLLMMLSIWMPQSVGLDKGDPGRIAAQVVSGIGFLGAGAFIKIGNNVKGMTTAASLWVVAAIGLTIGGGMWIAGLITLVLVLIALAALEPVERKLFPAERFKYIGIWFAENTADRGRVLEVLAEHGIRVQSVDASQDVAKRSTKLTVLAKIPVDLDIESLFKQLRRIGDVEKVKIEENA
ncbi:MAG TPA: MgtC/SapB family protein [Rectinemataceae bacterium]|nr:MgtC/SapB family protein [Rectinemataceae bacterium]